LLHYQTFTTLWLGGYHKAFDSAEETQRKDVEEPKSVALRAAIDSMRGDDLRAWEIKRELRALMPPFGLRHLRHSKLGREPGRRLGMMWEAGWSA